MDSELEQFIVARLHPVPGATSVTIKDFILAFHAWLPSDSRAAWTKDTILSALGLRVCTQGTGSHRRMFLINFSWSPAAATMLSVEDQVEAKRIAGFRLWDRHMGERAPGRYGTYSEGDGPFPTFVREHLDGQWNEKGIGFDELAERYAATRPIEEREEITPELIEKMCQFHGVNLQTEYYTYEPLTSTRKLERHENVHCERPSTRHPGRVWNRTWRVAVVMALVGLAVSAIGGQLTAWFGR